LHAVGAGLLASALRSGGVRTSVLFRLPHHGGLTGGIDEHAPVDGPTQRLLADEGTGDTREGPDTAILIASPMHIVPGATFRSIELKDSM